MDVCHSPITWSILTHLRLVDLRFKLEYTYPQIELSWAQGTWESVIDTYAKWLAGVTYMKGR